MAATFQQLCDRARLSLKDDAKDRYTDAELLVYANVAIGVIKRRRPDLFFGQYGTPLTPAALSDTYPLPLDYEVCMIDYLIARSESKDSEFADESRAVGFFAMFDAGLTN